jgi:hypothetical protein
VFADGTNMPADWAEWSKSVEGDIPFTPSGDVSIYPLMQFIHAMHDYFPEIDHPLKQAAYDAVIGYEKQVADKVAALAGHPDQQRDADYTYRYPGVAPLKAPLVLGPGDPVTLPQPATTAAPIVTLPPGVLSSLPEGQWEQIGSEGSRLTVDADTTVAYGSGAAWITKVISGEFDATNGFFGSDPAYGVVKQVYKQVTAAAPQPVPTPDPLPNPTPATEPVPTPVPVPDPDPAPQPNPEPAPTPDPQARYKLPFFKAVAGAIAFLETCGYEVTRKK